MEEENKQEIPKETKEKEKNNEEIDVSSNLKQYLKVISIYK